MPKGDNFPRATLIETELGTERLCLGCGEFWPYDPESLDPDFWYFVVRAGKVIPMSSRCKACWSERKLNRGRLPVAVAS